MHFDSDDEGVGGVRNPIISTVIYLTDGVGGPTLVTDQVLATAPSINRLLRLDLRVTCQLVDTLAQNGCVWSGRAPRAPQINRL
jgi:hypothetical protein